MPARIRSLPPELKESVAPPELLSEEEKEDFLKNALARRFGLRLKELRTAREWSQGDLAQKSRVSRTTINQIENGRVDTASIRVLRAIAMALGVAFVASFASWNEAKRWYAMQIKDITSQ